MIALRHGTAHAVLGADDDLEDLVTRLREKWPDGDIQVRADSGFGVPGMDEVCERLKVWDTFGIGRNPRLKRARADLRDQAVTQYDQTHEKQRRFTALLDQAGSWDRQRSVVIKAEAHGAGTNRRAVVTNRLGALIVPQDVDDDDVQRGERENRNKELKVDLCGGRLSDHRFMANLFRLCLHTTALNLIVRLRNELPDPDPQLRDTRPRPAPLPDAESPRSPTGAELSRAQPGHLATAADQSGRRDHREYPPRAGPPEFDLALAQPADLAPGPANGSALLSPNLSSPSEPRPPINTPREGAPPRRHRQTDQRHRPMNNAG